ncbi:hypothetical protein SAMN05216533_0188 [Streptomyces sp. Ag109_O5-10]|nr:hypothetical protein SAMN05216533_0188 [Streptomyces sp. Ag109_O5-10]
MNRPRARRASAHNRSNSTAEIWGPLRLVLPAPHRTFGENTVLPFIAERRRGICMITQVQHRLDKGSRFGPPA